MITWEDFNRIKRGLWLLDKLEKRSENNSCDCGGCLAVNYYVEESKKI